MTGAPSGSEFVPLEAVRRAHARTSNYDRSVQTLKNIQHRPLGATDGLIEPTAWEGKPIPRRQWIVKGLIPANTVTLLTGNGGDGKSLLALQLLKAAVTNTQWLGRDVKQVRAMGIFCEDDTDELMRRTSGTLNGGQETFGDLDGLFLIDRDGKESVMYEATHNEISGRTTQFFERVRATVANLGIELLVLDSLYNFFAGNENIRAQANEFVGNLKRLGRECGCASIVVAHPSRAGMGQGGDGTAGNTAWHNAVRARLYLHRRKHPSGDPEKKGQLVLSHMKSNYGKAEDEIQLEWQNGRFVTGEEAIQPPTPVDAPMFDRTFFGERES
jgi:RecA-family ATPase